MKIALDAGHGVGKDIGASGYGQEDILTQRLVDILDPKLVQKGHQVIRTRPTNALTVNESLAKRVQTANNAKADIFVSIHFNALNGRAHGSEVFAISNASRAIAGAVLDEIVSDFKYVDRGVKSANFYVLRAASMPSVLIECCFIDNKKDMAQYNEQKMARAICRGLIGESKDYSDRIGEKIVFEVTKNTYLKPSTEQAKDIDPKALLPLNKGIYKEWELLGIEEGHHLVKIKSSKYFIYSGHLAQIN